MPARTLSKTRLRLVFVAFFCALAVPTVALLAHAYEQLELDAFRRQQLIAEQLVSRIDASLREIVREADGHSYTDYGFSVLTGDPDGATRRLSVLAEFPVPDRPPGLVGYFQVDDEGALGTPLVPADDVDPRAFGISPAELAARRRQQALIRAVLAENRLVPVSFESQAALEAATRENAPTAPRQRVAFAEQSADERREEDAPTGQAGFDQLSVGSSSPPARAESASGQRAAPSRPGLSTAAEPRAAPGVEPLVAASNGAVRTERAPLDERDLAAPTVTSNASTAGAAPSRIVTDAISPRQTLELEAESPQDRLDVEAARITVFETELGPFSFSLLDTGHFVLFRNAWRDGRRVVQGALLEQQPFVDRLIHAPLAASPLAGNTAVGLAYAGRSLDALPAAEDAQALLRTRLAPPFADLDVALLALELPAGPGSAVLRWLTLVLALVLPATFVLGYRFSLRQLALARQQQDFVSAVSHELKTPLTSIRMYGEMLKSGWTDDARRKLYYDYIHNESERLSRLIDNVLALARMSRHGIELSMTPHSVAELLDLARSKVATYVEQAGFELRVTLDPGLDSARVLLDADCFVQIAINLVDNAVKFSRNADLRAVEIGMRRRSNGDIALAVRDFGPGVPRRTMRKLFELFYRADNELTRATAGTGIGLALVKQLAEAMNGRVDVGNRDPGAEFMVSFPPHRDD